MKKTPFILQLISYFYIFGAIMILISLHTKQSVGLNARLGIPNVPEQLIVILLAIFSLIMAYGFLKLKRWAYWTMLIYSILFLFISLSLVTRYNNTSSESIFTGNASWSFIVLLITFYYRKSFINHESVQKMDESQIVHKLNIE